MIAKDMTDREIIYLVARMETLFSPAPLDAHDHVLWLGRSSCWESAP